MNGGQNNSQVRVISANTRASAGLLQSIIHFRREIWSFRGHIYVVFGTRFRAAYSGTGFGRLWNYILPVVPLTVYLLLSKLRVFPDFEGIDSATFITFGVTLWFLFSGCLQNPIQVFQSRNVEAMKTSLPISASIISGFSQLFFDTLIRVCFVVLVIAFTQTTWSWHFLFLPVVLFPALLGFIGLGLALGILNIVYNDVSRVTNIILQYGIFISGVIFPVSNISGLDVLNRFNPFALYIDAARSVVFFGELTNLGLFLALSMISFLVFLVSLRIFYIMEYRVRGIE